MKDFTIRSNGLKEFKERLDQLAKEFKDAEAARSNDGKRISGTTGKSKEAK